MARGLATAAVLAVAAMIVSSGQPSWAIAQLMRCLWPVSVLGEPPLVADVERAAFENWAEASAAPRRPTPIATVSSIEEALDTGANLSKPLLLKGLVGSLGIKEAWSFEAFKRAPVG